MGRPIGPLTGDLSDGPPQPAYCRKKHLNEDGLETLSGETATITEDGG